MDLRIERLEKRVRRLYGGLAALLALFLVLAGYGAARQTPQLIRAGRFEVVDKGGAVVASLFSSGMGGHLTLNFPPGIGDPIDSPGRLEVGYEGLGMYQHGTFLTEMLCVGGSGEKDCDRVAELASAKKIGSRYFVALHQEIFRLAWQGNGGELLLFNSAGEPAAQLFITGSGSGGLAVSNRAGGERVFDSGVPD